MHIQSLNSISSKDLQALKNTKIFVVGDIILDRYIEGRISRISPEAPAPILLETQKKHVPGGAGNVASNIANIGAFVQVCGRIGNDDEAAILKNCLKNFQVNLDALFVEEHVPTTTKTRIVSHHEFTTNTHQIVRMDCESTEQISKHSVEFCLNAYQNFIKQGGARALVLSDYNKGVLVPELVRDLIKISNENNIPVIVDPKSINLDRYYNATVIKPNFAEGRALYQSPLSSSQSPSLIAQALKIAQYYLDKSRCRNIVMSLSQHGVLALGKDITFAQEITTDEKPYLHISTKALQVADVSGAGDTLIAFLAMGLAAQLPLSVATYLSNLAAGIVCGKMGTSVVHMDELFEKIHFPNQHSSRNKIVQATDILPVIQDLQHKKQKVVFTNGCFDILHAGHVQYLQKAKSLGDLLIIGLNSDASVKRLKGESRPVQTYEDRAQVLSALSCTDFIIEFDEDTPLNLIRVLKPDVLVKGADYTFETTVGAEDVVASGGHVQHVELLEGRSTSSILKRI